MLIKNLFTENVKYWEAPDGKLVPYTEEDIETVTNKYGKFVIKITTWPKSYSVVVEHTYGRVASSFANAGLGRALIIVSKCSKIEFPTVRDALIAEAHEVIEELSQEAY